MSAEYPELKAECEKTVEHLRKDLGRLRSGRASPSLLEGIVVDYYGSTVPLIQLGMVSAPEPRLVTVQIYDQNAVEAVEKAIQHADLGLNPSRDGNLIRINIPALNEDRRKDLSKKVRSMGEDAKVSVRNHRRTQIDEFRKKEKSKEISQDDLRRHEEQIQKIVDTFISQIDKLSETKEKEILEV